MTDETTQEWTDEGRTPDPTPEDVAEREYQLAQERERQRLGIIPGGPVAKKADELREALEPPVPAADDQTAGQPEAEHETDNSDLADMTRAQLDETAAGLGLDPGDYKNKAQVKRAVIAKRASG